LNTEQLLKRLKQLKVEIGNNRDELRGLLDEYDRLEANCDDAYYSIEEAIDKLSETI